MDQINNKPESELPWRYEPGFGTVSVKKERIIDGYNFYILRKDLEYIRHACNAYPKLIEFLQKQGLSLYVNWETEPISHQYLELLSELGEDARPNN